MITTSLKSKEEFTRYLKAIVECQRFHTPKELIYDVKFFNFWNFLGCHSLAVSGCFGLV